jgi:hypothetical protein
MRRLSATILACGIGLLSSAWALGAGSSGSSSHYVLTASPAVTPKEIVNRLSDLQNRFDHRVDQYVSDLRQTEINRRAAAVTPPKRSMIDGLKSSFFGMFRKAPAVPVVKTPVLAVTPTIATPVKSAAQEIDDLANDIIRTVVGIPPNLAGRTDVFQVSVAALLDVIHGWQAVLASPFGLKDSSVLSADKAEACLSGRTGLNLSMGLLNGLSNENLTKGQMADHYNCLARFYSEADALWMDYGLTLAALKTLKLLNGAPRTIVLSFYKYLLIKGIASYDIVSLLGRKSYAPYILLIQERNGHYLYQSLANARGPFLYDPNGFVSSSLTRRTSRRGKWFGPPSTSLTA